jgi:hypothetical protein
VGLSYAYRNGYGGYCIHCIDFGIFINSFLKSTRQGDHLRRVLTITGDRHDRYFCSGIACCRQLTDSVSILVPRDGRTRHLAGRREQPFSDVLVTTLVMLVWSFVFFSSGVLRFNSPLCIGYGMIRIFDSASLMTCSVLRDRKIFLFLLVMPITFTLLFGYAFGGFSGGESDSRLPVGFLDADESWLSQELQDTLSASEVIRPEVYQISQQGEMEQLVADEKLAAGLIVPPDYAHTILEGKPAKLILIADTSTPAGTTVKSAVITAANRLDSAVRTALIMEQAMGDQVPFDYAFDEAVAAWRDPPIQVTETTSSAIDDDTNGNMSLAHTSPGMMLQFAIASLLICGQVIVSERKSRSLQRLLTTPTNRVHILLGHYLAIFGIIFCQFMVLILFGQLLLKVNYQRTARYAVGRGLGGNVHRCFGPFNWDPG